MSTHGVLGGGAGDMSADITGGAGSYDASIEDMRLAAQALRSAVEQIELADDGVRRALDVMSQYSWIAPTMFFAPVFTTSLFAYQTATTTHTFLTELVADPGSPAACAATLAQTGANLETAITAYEEAEATAHHLMISAETWRANWNWLGGLITAPVGFIVRELIAHLADGPWELLGLDLAGVLSDSASLAGYLGWAVVTGRLNPVAVLSGDGSAQQDLLRHIVKWGEGGGLADLADRLIPGRTVWPVPAAAGMLVAWGDLYFRRTDMHLARLIDFEPPLPPSASVADLARLIEAVSPTGGGPSSAVGIERRIMADGSTTFVVAIPGTQNFWFDPHNANDLQSIGQSYLAMATPTSIAVVQALIASGARPTDKVVLAGHSMGGMNAVNLANDRLVTSRFNVVGVVTFGSPVAQLGAPPRIQTLHVEHQQDAVSMTDLGTAKPTGARTTVSVDMAQVDELEQFGFDAHGLDGYAVSAELFVDESDNPSVLAFHDAVADVLTADVVESDVWVYQATTSPLAPRNAPLFGVGDGPNTAQIVPLSEAWPGFLLTMFDEPADVSSLDRRMVSH